MNNTNKELLGLLGLPINKITSDSRDVRKGDVFVAIKGETFDGHDYINQAIQQGALVIVYKNGKYKTTKDTVFFKTYDTREALAILASNFYNNVHKKMKIIGITGTNGKTTTSEITYQLLNNLGRKTGLISTVSAKVPGKEFNTGYHVTTPNVLQLHKIISEMYKNNCEFVIVETTSHGIDQKRTWGLEFELCAITNITPEHLDYHKTFENYLKTKAKIFLQSKKAVLNKWDPSLNALLMEIPSDMKYLIVDYKNLVFPENFRKVFPGEYNLENGAMAYTIVNELVGVADLNILRNLNSICGRMENIPNNKGFRIIIDFAHDDTSLEKVLKEVRKLAKNNVILVFGCAGLRDRLKRSKMGKVSKMYANKVIVTAEDPRTEDLKSINKEIELGIKQTGGRINKDYYIIENRQEAINFAIHKLAKKGDVVLITGKGHERSMCFGTTEYAWSDQEAVIKALNA